MSASHGNPRYVQYARAHGRTPEEQMAADVQSGRGLGVFLAWHQARLLEYPGRVALDPARYDAWLVARVDAMLAGDEEHHD